MRSSPAPLSRLRALLRPSGGRLALVAAIAAAVLVLDQGTKIAALQLLGAGEEVEVLGGLFTLELYRNFAGPSGIFPDHIVALSTFSLLAVLVLAGVAVRVVSTLSAVTVGLLLGGALGNTLDRLLREPAPLQGGVVDWFQLTGRTNLMNIADLAIHAAIVVMLAGVLLGGWREHPAGEEGGAEEQPRRDADAAAT